ncbi:very short patch repair endonuclease [Trinickia mobilis]|uniref:very short patch repair endonuclease n=1 Tax=Trinickia mobilis TaxID=2816356 RepID=UPI001F5DB03A|nr:very short patch repair endonuclease [Trinickia mobilis]
MRRVRGKDTQPELLVRRLLHGLGYRFRIHRSELPGKPDIAFIRRRRLIFVHGCFWHQHGCGHYKMPQSSTDFWHKKLASNVERDRRHMQQLHDDGWQVLVIWECELRDRSALANRLTAFLGPTRI